MNNNLKYLMKKDENSANKTYQFEIENLIVNLK
jgi:hypothetical protein